MSKFSKNLIFIFLVLIIGFVIPRFSNAQTEGTVYVCPEVASLEEINPRCPGKIILKLGETINGLTLSTTTYEGKEYYLVYGFTNGGGGVNSPPVADANGHYQGDAGLPITFDASNSSDPNSDPLQYRWDFDNDGIWDTEWLNASTVNHIWNNDYEGNVKLEVSDGEFSATDTTTVKVKSPQTFKEEAISELEAAKADDKLTDKKINLIIKHIQNSLDPELWDDSSHLIFFKKEDCSDSKILELNLDNINFEDIFEDESKEIELKMNNIFKGKCSALKLGIKVFLEEFLAVKLLIRQKLQILEAITELAKADQLLTEVAIYDSKNTPIQNQKFQKLFAIQVTKAEEELKKAEKELSNNKPDKAIIKFSKAWLHAQLAMKFANLK